MKYKINNNNINYQLIKDYDLPEFVLRVLSSYDISSINDVLNYQQQPVVFENAQASVDLINKHIKNKSKIVIVGDYDCDGVLATSILVKTFAKLNVEVGYYIPNRLSDGYGLSIDLVKKFHEKDYDLIITVDNGIVAKEAIEYALDNNIEVLVSDHHQVVEEMLIDNVIYFHPKFSNLEYEVSGGYVAFLLSNLLLDYEDDYLHALAAITLISDVMPLVKGNRKFIRQALKNINNKQYLQIKSLASGFVDSAMIANVIAPKINALGRLNDIYNPNKLVKYFCSNNNMAIKNYALEIEEANNLRKQISSDYYEKFQDIKAANNLMFIEDEQLHLGIVGLLASRLTFQNNCVSFIATKENDLYKGSIRSIEQFNVYSILKEHDYLFETIGGHPQAMGVSYHPNNSTKIKRILEDSLCDEELVEKEHYAYEIEANEITKENIIALRYLEPFGNKFSQPVFLIRDAIILQVKPLKGGLYHKINFSYQGECFEAIVFNSGFNGKVNDFVDMIVKLGINNYRGNETINIVVEDFLVKI